MFQTNVAENIKTQIFIVSHLFLESCLLGDDVEKFGKAGQATYENVMQCRKHTICLPDKSGKNIHTPDRLNFGIR
jgi:hypothetical protein